VLALELVQHTLQPQVLIESELVVHREPLVKKPLQFPPPSPVHWGGGNCDPKTEFRISPRFTGEISDGMSCFRHVFAERGE